MLSRLAKRIWAGRWYAFALFSSSSSIKKYKIIQYAFLRHIQSTHAREVKNVVDQLNVKFWQVSCTDKKKRKTEREINQMAIRYSEVSGTIYKQISLYDPR